MKSLAMLEQQVFYTHGQDGHALYRIPALVVTKAGTVLAFCEGRKDSWADTGEIHLMLRRSGDCGKTWSDPRIIVQQTDTTCGNPCPVVDHRNGAVFLFFCKNPKLAGGTDLVAQGQGTRSVWMTRSDDDGVTWSEPADLSAAIKKPNWTWYATGPGHGVQLASGRLVVACCHTVAVNLRADDPEYSHIVYSDDGGATWRLGGEFGPGCDEPAVVELPDGRMYVNARNQAPGEVGRRAYALSGDGGLTFSPRQVDATLIEPTLWSGCQASMVRYSEPRTGVSGSGEPRTGVSGSGEPRTEVSGLPRERDCVLFANPATNVNERVNMAVRLSRDNCRTWPVSRVLHAGPAAYSDITVAPDGTILCLYEGGDENPYQTLRLARFSFQWLSE
jgi:sialidase-1